MGNYNELKVWKKSVELAVAVYRATRKYPDDEIFGLRMQMRRGQFSSCRRRSLFRWNWASSNPRYATNWKSEPTKSGAC